MDPCHLFIDNEKQKTTLYIIILHSHIITLYPKPQNQQHQRRTHQLNVLEAFGCRGSGNLRTRSFSRVKKWCYNADSARIMKKQVPGVAHTTGAAVQSH